MSRPRVVHSAVCVLLALITLLVYLPVRHYPFTNLDDGKYVSENPVVQAGLTWVGVKYAFTSWYGDFWHPLTCLSHMLDCQLFGLNAGMHHLVGVLFHAANAVLLFILLLRLTGACWPSAFVAALFAWHPLHVESVAWVAERKDVLSAFFGLLTLLAYVGYAQRRSTRDYLLALFFFACGLMAKPMLVTVPFVLLLLDYWPLQRAPNFELRLSTWRRLAWEKWPFFLLAAASCVVTFVAQKHGEAVASLKGHPLSARIGNAAVAYVEYLFKSVYPVNLAVFYPLPKEIPLMQIAEAMLVLAVITGLVWRARRQCPYLFTGWLWYLGMLVPVIGVVQVGLQVMADRFTYLPLIGVSIGVVFGLSELAKKLRLAPVTMILAAIIVLAGCLWATAWQLRYWRDSESLFRRDLAITTDNPVAQNGLGGALLETGHLQAAMEHFREALRLEPDSAWVHNNLGAALLQTGQPQEAIEQFREALRLEPDSARTHDNLGNVLLQTGHLQEAIEHEQEALRLDSSYAKAHNNLGVALLQTGQPQEAIEHFQEALRLEPDDALTHNNLAIALTQIGHLQEATEHEQEALRLELGYAEAHGNLDHALALTGHPHEAIEQFQEALQPDPDSARGQFDLGNALLQQGQVEQAITHYRAALKLEPNHVKSLNNLAWLLATCSEARLRNGQEAVQLAERACQLTDYKAPQLIGTLAAAYAEEGRFEDAAAASQKAHDLALALGQQKLALKNEELLQLFKNRQPYREPAVQSQ